MKYPIPGTLLQGNRRKYPYARGAYPDQLPTGKFPQVPSGLRGKSLAPRDPDWPRYAAGWRLQYTPCGSRADSGRLHAHVGVRVDLGVGRLNRIAFRSFQFVTMKIRPHNRELREQTCDVNQTLQA